MESSRTSSFENCGKENGMCSRDVNEDIYLERKEDIGILSEGHPKKMDYLLREVETELLFWV